MKLIRQIIAERGGDMGKSINIVVGFGAFVQGVKSVLEYSEDRVVLQIAEKELVICGKKLTVEEYFEGDIFIKGDVCSAAFE